MEVLFVKGPLTLSLTSFYDAPLVCEAAPKIGCGCRTKPVLAALDLQELVRGAWLRRSGTTVAVHWDQPLTEEDAMGIVNGAFAGEGKVLAVRDSRRVEQLFHELSNGALWYSVATVDELSSEEADLIAARIVRRLEQSEELRNTNTVGLQCAIAFACREILTNDLAASAGWRGPALAHAIVEAVQNYLAPHGLGELQATLSWADYRPLPGEPD